MQRRDQKSSTKGTIEEFMSTVPHAIEPHESLLVARNRMSQYHIRHLPVRSGGQIVGLLSERDLELSMKFRAPSSTLGTVEEIMTPDPYCVLPTVLLTTAAAEMAERRIGSAMVVDQTGHLLGIFTATDALRALAAFAAN